MTSCDTAPSARGHARGGRELDRVPLPVAEAEAWQRRPVARVMAKAVAESIPPDRSTIASLIVRLDYRLDGPAARSVRRRRCSTTGSTGGGAMTSASTARWPTSAAVRSSISAAAPGGSCCRSCATGTPSSASTARPADAGARGGPDRAPRAPRCGGARCWCAAICGRSPFAPPVRVRGRGVPQRSSTSRPTTSWCGSSEGVAARAASRAAGSRSTRSRRTRDSSRASAPDAADRWGRTAIPPPEPPGSDRVYSESHRLGGGRLLAMTFHYQPVDARGRRRGPSDARAARTHRLLDPDEISRSLGGARASR